MHRDHRGMNKYRSANDDAYQLLLSQLKPLCQSAIHRDRVQRRASGHQPEVRRTVYASRDLEGPPRGGMRKPARSVPISRHNTNPSAGACAPPHPRRSKTSQMDGRDRTNQTRAWLNDADEPEINHAYDSYYPATGVLPAQFTRPQHNVTDFLHRSFDLLETQRRAQTLEATLATADNGNGEVSGIVYSPPLKARDPPSATATPDDLYRVHTFELSASPNKEMCHSPKPIRYDAIEHRNADLRHTAGPGPAERLETYRFLHHMDTEPFQHSECRAREGILSELAGNSLLPMPRVALTGPPGIG